MQNSFWKDETGAVVSVELVLIATIAVLGLVVGLSEIAFAVVQEMDDISDAVGKLNQSYRFTGFQSLKNGHIVKSWVPGSTFLDAWDVCDGDCSGRSEITTNFGFVTSGTAIGSGVNVGTAGGWIGSSWCGSCGG